MNTEISKILLEDKQFSFENNSNYLKNSNQNSSLPSEVKTSLDPIKSKDANWANKDMENSVDSVKRSEMKACINGIRKIRDAVAVYCDNYESLKILKQSLKGIRSDQYSIDSSKSRLPRTD